MRRDGGPVQLALMARNGKLRILRRDLDQPAPHLKLKRYRGGVSRTWTPQDQQVGQPVPATNESPARLYDCTYTSKASGVMPM